MTKIEIYFKIQELQRAYDTWGTDKWNIVFWILATPEPYDEPLYPKNYLILAEKYKKELDIP